MSLIALTNQFSLLIHWLGARTGSLSYLDARAAAAGCTRLSLRASPIHPCSLRTQAVAVDLTAVHPNEFYTHESNVRYTCVRVVIVPSTTFAVHVVDPDNNNGALRVDKLKYCA